MQVNPGEAFTIRREDGQFQCITGKTTVILLFLFIIIFCDSGLQLILLKNEYVDHKIWITMLGPMFVHNPQFVYVKTAKSLQNGIFFFLVGLWFKHIES